MAYDIDVNKIRSNADIVRVVSSYLPLQQKGRNYVAVCPFHNDSNPSLTVSQEKQIYKCFSCNASGNVFTFVQEYEKIGFLEAVKKVCELTNQRVEGFEKVIKKNEVPKEKQVLYNLLNDLGNFYSYNLKNSSNKEAYEYIKNRGLEDKYLDEYRVGYAPYESEKTIKFLKAKGYSNDDILNSGVGIEANGTIYDRYNGRLVFPLFDTYNRIIGFSARKLPSSKDEAKYVNTTETPLFHKSNVLYNYYQAEKISRKIGFCYVLEGFMDVLALVRSGIPNAIAIMGTALTNEHIEMLKKLNCEIRLCFDNDRAGQEATLKNLTLLKRTQLKVRVVNALNQNKDPDEILKTQGEEELKKFLNNLISPCEFNINFYSKFYNLNNYEDQKVFLEKSLRSIIEYKVDNFDAYYLLDKIQSKTLFNKSFIENEYERLKTNFNNRNNAVQNVTIKQQKRIIDKYEEAEKRLIIYMLNDNKIIDKYNMKLGKIRNDAYRKIVACIVRYYANYDKVSYADIFNDPSLVQDKQVYDILCSLDPDEKLEEFNEEYFKILTEELEINQRIALVKEKIKMEKNIYAQAELLKELKELNKLKSKRSSKNG